MTTRRRDYVDVVVERGLLRPDSVAVEGCIGVGIFASLRVASALGPGGHLYMVENDLMRLNVHRAHFMNEGGEEHRARGVAMDWVLGQIEEQSELIRMSDILMFHDFIPLDKMTDEGHRRGQAQRAAGVFAQLVSARPKVMAFFLPDSKNPEGLAEYLRQFLVRCEVVDNVDMAAALRGELRDEWKGKAVIGTPEPI